MRQRLLRVRERIEEALARSGRETGSVLLVAVSKTFPAEAVVEAARAGLSTFGENRVQEAAVKVPRVAELLKAARTGLLPAGGALAGEGKAPTRAGGGRSRAAHAELPIAGQSEAEGAALPTWHLVGHLQSNKARQAVALFDLIHSVDSPGLAAKLEAAAAAAGKRQQVLIQVNVSGEGSKSGAAPAALRALVEAVVGCPHLECRGLMTIPPYHPEPERSRTHFAALRELNEKVRGWLAPAAYGGGLSMGMTEDFEVAIEEGATIVRVGRALFGQRPA